MKAKHGILIVCLAILIGAGLVLAPRFLQPIATQMSFYLYAQNDAQGTTVFETSPIFNLDGRTAWKMKVEVLGSEDEGHPVQATIPLEAFKLPTTTANGEVQIVAARIVSEEMVWFCEMQESTLVISSDGPQAEIRFDCEQAP